MAFIDGRLYIAGLSNEEFASKLRVGGVSVRAVDNGTSVEIFHGNHGAARDALAGLRVRALHGRQARRT